MQSRDLVDEKPSEQQAGQDQEVDTGISETELRPNTMRAVEVGKGAASRVAILWLHSTLSDIRALLVRDGTGSFFGCGAFCTRE